METEEDTLLIFDPDPNEVSALAAHFGSCGYAVDTSGNLGGALQLARNQRYSAFIIGPARASEAAPICRHIRKNLRLFAPIVIISDSATISWKLQAFDDGADDYLVKPLSLAEVELRIGRRIVRSRSRSCASPLRVSDLVLGPHTHSAERGEHALKLTRTTFRILELLMLASPRVVSRGELSNAIWQGAAPDSDALRSLMYQLRKQVNRRGLPPLLHTVRARGFQIALGASIAKS